METTLVGHTLGDSDYNQDCGLQTMRGSVSCQLKAYKESLMTALGSSGTTRVEASEVPNSKCGTVARRIMINELPR